MLKGSEVKNKSIIVINGKPFFVAFKSKTAGDKETVLTGLLIEDIIKTRYWPINDEGYEFLHNYLVDESGNGTFPDISECSRLSGIEKMKLQTILLNNQLSEVAACID